MRTGVGAAIRSLAVSRPLLRSTRFDRPPRPELLRGLLLNTVAALAILSTACATLGDIARHPDAALVKSDFAAFYCGSVVLLEHQDPYALTPLQACQTARVAVPGGVASAAAGIDPDPLPTYDMAFFAPFAALPYRAAALLWDALLAASLAGVVVILAALTGFPRLVLAAIVAYALGFVSIPYGQIAPLLTLGLALAAYGLERGRRGIVLVGAALTLIEPHVGIPACLALFVWRPALRRGLSAIVVGLAGAGVVAAGLPITLEYLRVELPAHAAAESATAIQYSLTWLLHYAGVADALALKIGSAQYALTVLAGVGLAGYVARRLNAPAAIALFPPAMGMIGGPFIHLQQIAAALPFALLAVSRLSGGAARLAWVCVALLAVPWPLPGRLMAFGGVLIVLTVALSGLVAVRPRIALAGAALAAAVYVVAAGPLMLQFIPALPRHELRPAPPMPRTLDGDRLASELDATEVRVPAGSFGISTPRTLAVKIPTWFALCAIIVAALAGATRSPAAGTGAFSNRRETSSSGAL